MPLLGILVHQYAKNVELLLCGLSGLCHSSPLTTFSWLLWSRLEVPVAGGCPHSPHSADSSGPGWRCPEGPAGARGDRSEALSRRGSRTPGCWRSRQHCRAGTRVSWVSADWRFEKKETAITIWRRQSCNHCRFPRWEQLRPSRTPWAISEWSLDFIRGNLSTSVKLVLSLSFLH